MIEYNKTELLRKKGISSFSIFVTPIYVNHRKTHFLKSAIKEWDYLMFLFVVPRTNRVCKQII